MIHACSLDPTYFEGGWLALWISLAVALPSILLVSWLVFKRKQERELKTRGIPETRKDCHDWYKGDEEQLAKCLEKLKRTSRNTDGQMNHRKKKKESVKKARR